MNIDWNTSLEPLTKYFRMKRLESFIKAYSNLAELKVLDVGGTPNYWDLLEQYFGLSPKSLVLLNNTPLEDQSKYEYICGDGRNLAYADNSFDLVFSNSVIEHVGDRQEQLKFAQECIRVGKEIYIQTPNHWFPIEPHLLALFIHWLPKKLYKQMSFLSLHYLVKVLKGKFDEVPSQWVDTINLLSQHQFQALFPNYPVAEEQIFGLTKSLIVSSRKL